jgi:NADH dehydrogenase
VRSRRAEAPWGPEESLLSATDLGRILVTGANGQLGRALAARVAADPALGAEIRGVVRSERAAAMLRELGNACPEIRVLDYADAEALAAAAEGCRFAVHLVGVIAESKRSRYVDAHEAASAALARAADRAGLERMVYLSILGVDASSRNPCLASKGVAERILLRAKTPAVVLRVPMVLGPGDRTSRILRAEAHARWLPMIGGGRSHTQPIYAGDVVEGILAALTRPGLEGGVFDLAGPESLPARELVARVAALYGRRPRILPLPLGVARAGAWLAGRLMDEPPFTPAMLEVIAMDDRVDPEPTRARLGIELTPLGEVLERCCGPEGAP